MSIRLKGWSPPHSTYLNRQRKMQQMAVPILVYVIYTAQKERSYLDKSQNHSCHIPHPTGFSIALTKIAWKQGNRECVAASQMNNATISNVYFYGGC